METVERLFNMVVSYDDIRKYTPKQVVKLIKENKELTVTSENNIDIVIKYFPNRSIDTSDLYTIIDDLADDGKEVILLALDYIKRIKPSEYGKDNKEELKNTSNELKTLALYYDIPVVTCQQINRAGASAIDAAIESDKADLIRFLGRGNIADAWEIVENTDVLCFIQIEKKRSTGKYYLSFKRAKIRYKDLYDVSSFSHPFDGDNKMRLMDDIHLDKSLSESSLISEFDGVELLNTKGKRNATEREEIEEPTLFDFSKSLNSKK